MSYPVSKMKQWIITVRVTGVLRVVDDEVAVVADATGGAVCDVVGDVAEGDLTEGDVAEGDVAEGDVADGDVAEGDVTEGVLTEGDVAEGDVTGDVTGDVPSPSILANLLLICRFVQTPV